MFTLDWEWCWGRLEIIEVNRGERFADVEGARLAGIVHAIPIVDPVSGVGVLLNLSNDQAGADGMEATRWYEQRFTGMNGELVKTFLEGRTALFDGGFELLAGDVAAQAGNQRGVRRGVEDVPHLSFGFAAEQRGQFGWRVNLEREPFTGVEQFDEEWKTAAMAIGAEQLRAVLLDELAESLAGRCAVGDNGLGISAVADFPCFADVLADGNGFTIAGEGVTAPNAFDEDWVKLEWIKHVALAVG